MKKPPRNMPADSIRCCRICVWLRSRSRGLRSPIVQEITMEPVCVERFFLGCLAHASYMIASEGVAAVIDPQRDVDLYLKAAAANGWKIDYIIETHLHADFV